ncbi:MAG: hypothetical protein ACK559_26510 [bacterium]
MTEEEGGRPAARAAADHCPLLPPRRPPLRVRRRKRPVTEVAGDCGGR